MKNFEIAKRVEELRTWIKGQGLEAMVIPTMDPHNSEYVAEHWQCRRWVSGFTGSAGTAVITMTDALLWTDSRYWLQAEEQLKDTPYHLMKDLVDVTVNEWFRINVKGKVGYCNDMMTPALKEELLTGVEAMAVKTDPFNLMWHDRPAFPLSKAERMPDETAGETAENKLHRLIQWLNAQDKESVLVTELSEIAWLLNLRGDDIPFNPFIIAFLLVQRKGSHTLYVHKEQIEPDIEAYLKGLNITLEEYENAPRHLEGETPISVWRSIKNPVEQEGFRKAHLRDGIAMVKFLRRLDETEGKGWTEVYVDKLLTSLRAEQPGFRGLSFETIASYGAHGAIVHYEPSPETDIPLEQKSFLLLDSGGHYDCGSTDITRTIPLGPLTEEERKVYTLVLKGHLQLQNIHFPDGTTGLQLDTAARMPIWRAGYDFATNGNVSTFVAPDDLPVTVTVAVPAFLLFAYFSV